LKIGILILASRSLISFHQNDLDVVRSNWLVISPNWTIRLKTIIKLSFNGQDALLQIEFDYMW